MRTNAQRYSGDQERPMSQSSTEQSTQELRRYLETLRATIQSDINSLPTRRVPLTETLANARYVDFLHRQRTSIGAAGMPGLTPDPRLGIPSHRSMGERSEGTCVAQKSSLLERVLALSLDRDSNLNGATGEEECSDQVEESSQFDGDDGIGTEEQGVSQSDEEHQ
jgi:hypothetical protein